MKEPLMQQKPKVKGVARLCHRVTVRMSAWGAHLADVMDIDGNRHTHTAHAVEGNDVWTDAGRFKSQNTVEWVLS